MSFNGILIVLIVILLFSASCQGAKKDSFKDLVEDYKIESLGFIASHYIDNYKWMPIKRSQKLYTLFDIVNLVHPDDILFVKINGKFKPAAHVVSIMEIDKSFPVIVLDRSVQIVGREFGVMPTSKSVKLKNTTLFPDPIKTPVTEIQSVSRWVAAVPNSQLTY
jgi:hypothetical protein